MLLIVVGCATLPVPAGAVVNRTDEKSLVVTCPGQPIASMSYQCIESKWVGPSVNCVGGSVAGRS